jgi:hypothetical protein
MDRRTCLLWLAASAATSARAQAVATPPPEALAALPGARLQGSGRLRFFGLHIYDARLWVGDDYPRERPASEDWGRHAFLLELQYARSLEGVKIAERSITEMERAGPLPKPQAEGWLAFMSQAFPNVVAGTRLSALHRPGETVRFYVDGRAGREIRDGAFADRFFGIWLGPNTSEPAMRLQLLGSAR